MFKSQHFKKHRGDKYAIIISVLAVVYLLLCFIKVYPGEVTVGFFAGECMNSNCHATYTITDKQIIIDDTSDQHESDRHRVIHGDFKDLRFGIPPVIIGHISGRFGCPDCTDGGGYILGFKLLGIPFSYAIDHGSEPWYFNDVTDIIRERMALIQKIDQAHK